MFERLKVGAYRWVVLKIMGPFPVIDYITTPNMQGH